MTEPVETSAAEAAAHEVPLRKRPIPDQLDYWSTKLAAQLDTRKLPRDAIVAIGAAVVGLGVMATEVRALLDEREQQHGERTVAAQTDRLTIEGLSALHERAAAERDAAIARAEQAETERDQACAELAQMRADVNEQWGVKWADRHRVAEYESEDLARREHAAAIDPANFNLPASRLLHRLVGEWRDAEPEDGERG